MKKTRIPAFLLALCIALSMPANALAASGEAEVFWFRTAGECGTARIKASLSSMGYNAHRYVDCNANGVRIDMGTDKVFAVAGMGQPGRVYCYNSATTMSGNAVASDSSNYSLAAAYSENAFSGMKFAYYGTNYSALTNATYGNLPSKTVSLGASAALGFQGNIYYNCSAMFEDMLFFLLDYGYDVATAANAAKIYVGNTGTYGAVDTYQIYGSPTTKIF